MHVDLRNEIEDNGNEVDDNGNEAVVQHRILLGTKSCQLPSSALEQ